MMDKPMSALHFRFMKFGLKVRDYFAPRRDILLEIGMEPGSVVLDFGCGPGGYVASASEMAGASGKVYALDIHPRAVESVRRLAAKKRLTNVETILSARDTGLPDGSVDVVLLYDILHMLEDQESILRELQRVLKPDGILSFSDHHMKEPEIISEMTQSGLFKLVRKGKKTYSFTKCE
jgi:ubiquinone/menaquinone biosynthesis C-methylase UbiE